MIAKTIYAHARRSPDRIAIVYNNSRLSYRQFARLIDASRQYLATQELAGDGVAVLAIASVLDAWIQGLALRSLGLTTIIVRSLNEIDRLGLRDIRCVVAMEDARDLDGGRANAGWRIIRVPRSISAGAMTGAAPNPPETPARHGGHIQLTSGTTGIYKKILIDPEGEAKLIRLRQNLFKISKRSVVNIGNFGGWTSMGYRFATATWDAEGCVVLYEGPNKHHAFQYDGITDVLLVPHMLVELLAAPAGALRRDDRIRLIATGAPLSLALAEEAKARLTSRIFTYYASSEGGAVALTPFKQAEDLRWHRILGSREVEIVDESDRPLPSGQVGSVRVRLIGPVSGYLAEEEASQKFFRDGYFYPGDLGIIRADGRLALQGRVTDVVNVLGDKVAVGPIEEALQQQLRVTGVCVFSMPDETGEEIIHVVIEARGPLPQADLTAGLATVLPSACRVEVRFLDALPRNSMGKIRRDALKQRPGMPANAE